MGWKRSLFELIPRACSSLAPRVSEPSREPNSIFVLRNNDLGDLLVVTPLFDALKRRFPKTRIVAGVGDWAAPILQGNPNVDEILSINAPWHNAQLPAAGPLGAFDYILRSREAARLAAGHFDIGIDVLGSAFGSLLLMRAGIPFRLGVLGYAGGHSATQGHVHFNPREHVGRSALRFAELLGVSELPECRPQIFLRETPEPSGAIVVAPGGGYAAKCWPAERFADLVRQLGADQVIVIGGKKEKAVGELLEGAGSHVVNLTGQLTLRQTFAVIAASQMVVCNASMAMHAAAAFRKPSLVPLGEAFTSVTEHAIQWTYPETVSLPQPSVAEAYQALRNIMANIR